MQTSSYGYPPQVGTPSTQSMHAYATPSVPHSPYGYSVPSQPGMSGGMHMSGRVPVPSGSANAFANAPINGMMANATQYHASAYVSHHSVMPSYASSASPAPGGGAMMGADKRSPKLLSTPQTHITPSTTDNGTADDVRPPRVDLRVRKAVLDKLLGDSAGEYWRMVERYMHVQLSKQEFDQYVVTKLGEAHLHAHNDFFLSVLQNAYSNELPPKPSKKKLSAKKESDSVKKEVESAAPVRRVEEVESESDMKLEEMSKTKERVKDAPKKSLVKKKTDAEEDDDEVEEHEEGVHEAADKHAGKKDETTKTKVKSKPKERSVVDGPVSAVSAWAAAPALTHCAAHRPLRHYSKPAHYFHAALVAQELGVLGRGEKGVYEGNFVGHRPSREAGPLDLPPRIAAQRTLAHSASVAYARHMIQRCREAAMNGSPPSAAHRDHHPSQRPDASLRKYPRTQIVVPGSSAYALCSLSSSCDHASDEEQVCDVSPSCVSSHENAVIASGLASDASVWIRRRLYDAALQSGIKYVSDKAVNALERGVESDLARRVRCMMQEEELSSASSLEPPPVSAPSASSTSQNVHDGVTPPTASTQEDAHATVHEQHTMSDVCSSSSPPHTSNPPDLSTPMPDVLGQQPSQMDLSSSVPADTADADTIPPAAPVPPLSPSARMRILRQALSTVPRGEGDPVRAAGAPHTALMYNNSRASLSADTAVHSLPQGAMSALPSSDSAIDPSTASRTSRHSHPHELSLAQVATLTTTQPWLVMHDPVLMEKVMQLSS